MAEETGSGLLAQQMRNEGVEDLFYIMGGPIVEVAGSAADNGIRTIDCRHEQGAAMAAHGYARVKRSPGVCLAASGPATTNLLTGDRERVPGRRADGGAGRRRGDALVR